MVSALNYVCNHDSKTYKLDETVPDSIVTIAKVALRQHFVTK